MTGATFAKHEDDPAADLVGEAEALEWLGEAEKDGGLHAARVVSATSSDLVEERVRTCSPTPKAARAIGRGLAITHAAGADWWGCPPTGSAGNRWNGGPAGGYVIARSVTPVVADEADAPAAWGAFYAEWRLRAYERQLSRAHELSGADERLIERVCSRLEDGDFDAPQPALVVKGGHDVARLHGDLWAGNVLYAGDSGALIDPMAHGGHAETDLAMLALFGFPYLDEVIAGYEEVSPLADGWRSRVGLHQLAPLLHHCVLYGDGYFDEMRAVARRYA